MRIMDRGRYGEGKKKVVIHNILLLLSNNQCDSMGIYGLQWN